jgi:hypothetical protein
MASAQTPSPIFASTRSAMVFTWNVSAQAGGAVSRLMANPPSAAVVMVLKRRGSPDAVSGGWCR